MPTIVAGKLFDGVECCNAHGQGHGYFLGNNIELSETCKIDPDRDRLIAVKYFHHATGETRLFKKQEGNDYSLTILVGQGCWLQRLWDEATGCSVSIILSKPGDYIAWHGESIQHEWEAIQESTMMTVRWLRVEKQEGHLLPE